MALSNVLREPRRELIEQGLGVLVIAGFIGLDYFGALQIYRLIDGANSGDFAFALFLATLAIPIGFLSLLVIHLIGEIICDLMADRGYDPRPTNRYR